MCRLIGVGWQWFAMSHITKRAAPSTKITQDHKRCRALAKALSNIWARRLLAHRVQLMFTQQALNIMVALPASRLNAYPLGLTQSFVQLNNLNWVACRLGRACLFFYDRHSGSSP